LIIFEPLKTAVFDYSLRFVPFAGFWWLVINRLCLHTTHGYRCSGVVSLVQLLQALLLVVVWRLL